MKKVADEACDLQLAGGAQGERADEERPTECLTVEQVAENVGTDGAKKEQNGEVAVVLPKPLPEREVGGVVLVLHEPPDGDGVEHEGHKQRSHQNDTCDAMLRVVQERIPQACEDLHERQSGHHQAQPT